MPSFDDMEILTVERRATILLKGGIGMKGKLKKIIRGRGYGFISAEDGGVLFFHRSALVGIDFDALEEGVQVEFDSERGPKGPWAVNVKIREG